MISRLGPVSEPEEEDMLWLVTAFDIWEDDVKLKDDDGSAELAITLMQNLRRIHFQCTYTSTTQNELRKENLVILQVIPSFYALRVVEKIYNKKLGHTRSQLQTIRD